MIRTFEQLREEVKNLPNQRVAVAAAGGRPLFDAIEEVRASVGLEGLLVGDEKEIRDNVDPSHWEIVHEPDPVEAVRRAAALGAEGRADMLMKGNCKSADFLRVVLNPDFHLRGKSFMSHVFVFTTDRTDGMKMMSDGAIKVRPNVREKTAMIENAVHFAKTLGMERPKVAVLSGTETPLDTMPDSLEAAEIAADKKRWEALGCDVAGPLALDVAVNERAAEIKGVKGPVAGNADVFIVPDVVSGNVFGKSVIHIANSDSGGLILGARAPIVLLSRSDTARQKVNSLVLGIFAAAKTLSSK